MLQVFRKKMENIKYAIGIVVCVVLVCLCAENAQGQEIVEHHYENGKYCITVENNLEKNSYLIIIKTSQTNLNAAQNLVQEIADKYDRGNRVTNINSIDHLTGSNYLEDEPYICLLYGQKKQISFRTKHDYVCYYKLIDGNFSRYGVSPGNFSALFPDTPKDSDNLNVTSPPEEQPVIAPVEKEKTTVIVSNKKTVTSNKKPTIELKNYNPQISKLEIEVKQLFRSVFSLKEENLTDYQRDILLPKNMNEARDLLDKTNALSEEIRNEINVKNKLDCEKRLNGLKEKLQKTSSAIVNLRTLLSPKVKENLRLKFQEEFIKIISEFKVLDSCVVNGKLRDADTWYNWWGKWKYIKILDNLEKNKENYIKNSTAFIDSICKEPEYEKGRGLLDNEKQNILVKFDEIKIYRHILKTDYAIPLKVHVFGALLVIIVVVIIILITINARNKKIKKTAKKEKEKMEEKLGKSTFKKIDTAKNENNNAAPPENISAPIAEKPKFRQLHKYEHGLDEVKANVEKIYKEINMFDFVDSSSIHKVYISRDVIKELYKFFNEFLKSDAKVPETGCYLVGRWDYAPNTNHISTTPTDHISTSLNNQQLYDISLEYMVKPGRDAKYSEYECDFGAEIGTSLIMENRKYSEQTNTEYVHTSWMHSHPGLQLFLSSQDIIVQSTLTNNSPYKRMLAIVIDTINDFKMAFFTPKSGKDNIMNNAEDIKKTITLDELYHWAESEYSEQKKEKPIVKMKKSTTVKEYFSIPLKQKAENFDEIKLTRASIIDMSMANRGFLYGKNQDNKLLIDEFLEEFDNNQNEISAQIGMFKKISNFDSTEWQNLKQTLVEDTFWKTNKILAIYCLNDKNLYLFTSKQNANTLEEQNLPNIATVIPLQDLKSWTREKRK